MPQRAAPVECIGFARGRRIHDEKLSEADAQRADSSQPERADREISMVRVHLESDRPFGFESILLAKRVVSLLEKLRHVWLQDDGFLLVQFHLEMRRVEPGEMFEAIEQSER